MDMSFKEGKEGGEVGSEDAIEDAVSMATLPCNFKGAKRERGDNGRWGHGLAILEGIELLREADILLGKVLDMGHRGAQDIDTMALGLTIIVVFG
ncbi:hypothetical protein BGZ98_004114, partial [Dissophora globulifera]